MPVVSVGLLLLKFSFGTAWLSEQKNLSLVLQDKRKGWGEASIYFKCFSAFISNQLQEKIYRWDLFSWDPVIMQSIPRFSCLLQETGTVMTYSVTFRNVSCISSRNEEQDSFGPSKSECLWCIRTYWLTLYWLILVQSDKTISFSPFISKRNVLHKIDWIY